MNPCKVAQCESFGLSKFSSQINALTRWKSIHTCMLAHLRECALWRKHVRILVSQAKFVLLPRLLPASHLGESSTLLSHSCPACLASGLGSIATDCQQGERRACFNPDNTHQLPDLNWKMIPRSFKTACRPFTHRSRVAPMRAIEETALLD